MRRTRATRPKHPEQKTPLQRAAIGFAGGVVAVLAKYLLRDHLHLSEVMDLEEARRIIVGYLLGGLVLSLVGAAAAWHSELNRKRYLFFVGWVVPAVLAAMLPELASNARQQTTGKIGLLLEQINPISIAYAQSSDKPECIGDYPVLKGFKLFFGIQDQYDRYRVIVGSKKEYDEALARAKAVNAEDPTLKAHVGPRRCGNEFWPVVLNGDLPLKDAKTLLERARKLNIVPTESYLSPVPQ